MTTDKMNPSTEEPEDKSLEMETGEKEAEVYTEEGREKLVENDEMSPTEEAFMEGAKMDGEQGVCAKCGKPLNQDDKSSVKEKEVDGEVKWFCSDKCAEDFESS